MTSIEPRPTTATEEMRIVAAKEIVSAMLVAGIDLDGDTDRLAKNIADAARWAFGRDGYHIAKLLDDRHGWEIDDLIVDELANFDSALSRQVKAAQADWAERNNIQPPYPVGTPVSATWGGKKITGTIHEISGYHVASYSIACDDGRSGFPIVKFEDVEALTETAT